MKCSKCGKDLNPNSKFCDNCGAPVQFQQPQYATSPVVQNNKPQPKKEPWYMNKKIVLPAVAGAIVLLLIFATKVTGNNSSSSSTDNDYSITENFDDEEMTEAQTEKETKKPKKKKKKMSKSEYKNSCGTITYKELARNPEKFKGKKYKITGQIFQVTDDDTWFSDKTALKLNITAEKNEYADGGYLWTDLVYALVDIPKGKDKILEDDVITFWGKCTGEKSYTSVLGDEKTVPSFEIKYYEVQ